MLNITDFHDLHPDFLRRMESQLGDTFADFLRSYDSPRRYGLRVNTGKIFPEEFEKICPFEIRPIPWVEGGYFYNEDVRPSRCPLYQAGLYYLQDPGAMIPASLLPVNPGDRVLDLCAAPGGKATALLSKLGGTGILFANDISSTRAKALLRNLELFGATNSVVLNEDPGRLSDSFPEFFDKILLDAPCSGEGMFRKDPSLAADWSPEKSAALANLQKKLLDLACHMLRPGGMLLYSTCTFSREEDEDVIWDLLSHHPEMHQIKPAWYEGFACGISPEPGFRNDCCVRIYPHRMDSEGQFAALLQKEEAPGQSWEQVLTIRSAASTNQRKNGAAARAKSKSPDAATLQQVTSFFNQIGLRRIGGRPLDPTLLEIRGSMVYYSIPDVPDLRGLKFIRCGLYLGELKKNRFEPSVSLALALLPDDATSVIRLPASDPRLSAYLTGAPISIRDEEARGITGWTLLATDRYPLSFGKLVAGQLKNKYPAGWRILGL